MAHVEIKQIKKSFATTDVLRGVNLTLNAGSQTALLGASGSGKSTLLYLLGGLDRPTQGEIIVDGMDLNQLDDDALADYRNKKIGFIFQFHFLLPSMKCLENILLPAQIGAINKKMVQSHIMELARFLEVEHCLDKFPYQISGGEQQRINIIRALSLKPALLLCDEPTGNLDSFNSKKVVELLKKISFEQGVTLLVVTHDHNVASQLKDKITIEDGRIIS